MEWVARATPLPIAGVFAEGAAARRLAERLLALDDAALALLEGVADARHLVALGADPPWADGVVYLGRGPDPRVLMPTHEAPAMPLPLFCRAVLRETRGGAAAVVPGRIVDLGAARAIDRATLAAATERFA